MRNPASKTLLSVPAGLAALLMFAATSQAMWQVSDQLTVEAPGAIESQLFDVVLRAEGLDAVTGDDNVSNHLSVYLTDPNAQEADSEADAMPEAGPMVRLELADGTEIAGFSQGSVSASGIFDDCEDSCTVYARVEIMSETAVTAAIEVYMTGVDESTAPEGLSVTIEEHQPDG